MQGDEAEVLIAADAVCRIGGELGRLSGELRTVERVLFPVIIRAGSAIPGSPEMRELQRFDLIMQSIDGLAVILTDLAASLRHDPHVDVTHLIARAKLAILSARPFEKAIDTSAPDAVDLLCQGSG